MDYSYWARNRLYAAADGLSEAEYGADNGFVYPSVRAVMTHMANSEGMWLARCKGEEVVRLAPEEVPNLESLQDRWAGIEKGMRQYLDSVTFAEVGRGFEIVWRDGSKETRSVGDVLSIVLFHSAQHRAEAAEALTRIGRSPGNLDYLFYLREREG